MRGALSLMFSATCACGGAGGGVAPQSTTPEAVAAARPSWVVDDDPLAIAADAPVEHLAGRELVPQWGHTAGVRELRWLPSGPLAVLDDLGHLALLEPSSGERLLWERPAPPAPWEELFEVDRSGRYLRVGRHVHDLRSGDERELPLDLRAGTIAAAAPDLSAFAWSIRDPDGVTRLHVDGADGTARFEAVLDLDRVSTLAWSPTARSLLVGNADVLQLLAATDGAQLLRVDATEDAGDRSLVASFRPTGGALAIVSGGDLTVVDPRTATELGSISSVAPAGAWVELRWSADGGRLAIARRDDEDAIVMIVDAHDGSRVAEVRVPFGLPSEAALSPDAHLLAVGTSDGRVHVHEAEGGGEILVIDSGRSSSSAPFTFDPRARFLAVAGTEAIELWDLELREEIGGFYQPGAERHVSGTLRGLGAHVGIVAADADASYLWTPDGFHMDEACAFGGTIRRDAHDVVRVVSPLAVCDLSHGITVRPGWWIRASSSDGHLIVNANGGLFVEDATTGERRTTLALEDGERPPCSTSACGLPVAISDDGAYVAVARRTLLRLFDGRTGREVARTDVGSRTAALAFAPNGRALSFVGEDERHVVFDVPGLAIRLERPSASLASAFSEDSRFHAYTAAGSVGVVSLRGRAAPVEVPLGEDLAPDQISFLGDGARFALFTTQRSSDHGRRTLELRTSTTGALLESVSADALAISADGRRIARCDAGALEVVSVAADGHLGDASAAGPCRPGAALELTDDGAFVYVDDDEGLWIARASDGAQIALHLVDVGWGVTAPVVRDDASRWDDGGYFDGPFLLRGEGEITSASLDDARSSFVPGLAGYFVRSETPPMDEAAQPDDEP